MAPKKSERLVNLTICLLSTRRFLARERIRELVEGYDGLSDAAFERAFERDKEDLRRMGVPVDVGSNDVLFEDEVGYRITRADFELPPVDFTPAETAVLGAAAQVWEQASAAASTGKALAKLRAAGVEPEPDRLATLSPRISAREPAFDLLWQATLSRTCVTFGYRGSDETRTLAPWTLSWRRGAWYVLGHDQARQAPRLFKLSRISAGPELVGQPDAYQVPSVDLAELAQRLEPQSAYLQALVAIKGDRAPALRRRGVQAHPDRPLPPDFRAWSVPYANDDSLAAELCASGPDVLVLAPVSLALKVRTHLTRLLAAQEVRR